MLRPSRRPTTRSQKGKDHEEKIEIRQKQNDQDEACLNPVQKLQWLALNRRAEEIEKDINENKIKHYEERIAELKQQLKRSAELNDVIKNIDEMHQQDLRLLDIQKQRSLEHIEADYTTDCEELQEKYQIAQQKLSIAWKELYPRGKRRKTYPKSIKELLDRYDPPEDSLDDEQPNSDKPSLIRELIDRVDSADNESEKDRRYRLYRLLTKKNEEEIKGNLAQMYYNPDDTPEPTDVLQSPFTGSSSPSPRPSRTASPPF